MADPIHDLPLDPLSELAIQHGTDKFGLHDYTPNYHRLFEPFRDRPIRLLEIGVGGYADEDRGGQSLATWRDYFPQARVVGIDIQRKAVPLGERVRILQGSQVDPEFLARLVAEEGPFDLIVDDGSHRNEHVVESFRLLWPTLAPGGIYAVEDVQTAVMPRFGGSLDLAAPNSVGLFADLTEQAGGEVARVVRFHNIVAAQKAGATLHPLDAGDPAVALLATCDEADLRAAFDDLPVPGQLRLEGRPGEALQPLLRRLFAQVDHREIAHAFPGTPTDPMAPLLQRIEVDGAGVTLRKAPNDYPSNFSFDPRHPEAAAALAAMERVLEGSDREEGLAHYASLVTTHRGREAAAPWLARLDALGATSRVYHQLAGGLAMRERRMEDAARHYGAGVARYPDDRTLVQGFASALLALGRPEVARDALVAALTITPRVAAYHLLLARVAERLGDPEPAVGHAVQAVAFSSGERRCIALAALGEILARADRGDEALSAFVEATRSPGRAAARAWIGLSGLRAARGEVEAAQEAARRAVALHPDRRGYRDWLDRLAASGAAAQPVWSGEEERDSLAA